MKDDQASAEKDVDVFVSYKREERQRIVFLVERLRAMHLSVWFDADLNAGMQFDQEIMHNLNLAKAQLVCWSTASVDSRWVRSEATIGANKGILLPVFLEPCQLLPPFNIDHVEDIADFTGQPSHRGWHRILERIGQLTGRGAALTRWEQITDHSDSRVLRQFVADFPADPLALSCKRRVLALELAETRDRLISEFDLAGDEVALDPESRVEKLQEECARLRVELTRDSKRLADQREAHAKAVEALQGRLDALAADQTASAAAVEALGVEKQQLQSELALREARIDELEAAQANEDELHALHQGLKERDEAVIRLTRLNEVLEERVGRLNQTVHVKDQDLADVQRQVRAHSEATDAQEREKTVLMERIKTIESDHQTLKAAQINPNRLNGVGCLVFALAIIIPLLLQVWVENDAPCIIGAVLFIAAFAANIGWAKYQARPKSRPE